MKRKSVILTMFIFILVTLLIPGKTAQAKKKTKKISFSKASVTLNKKFYTYTGKEITPKVKVTLNGKKLKINKDYKINYLSNCKVGTAKIKITAKNKKKYSGTKTKTFRIKKAERSLVPERTRYSAVEGDGSFSITAKPSKGGGTITYSCDTEDVVHVTKAGKVTVIGNGTATVSIKVKATACYKMAKTSVKIKIQKKPVRTVDADTSIKTYNYPILNYACENRILTDFSWTIVDKYIIPGLAPTAEDDLIQEYIQCNNLCPQGICIAGDYLLTTAYCMDDVHESCVFVYDREAGTYLNTLILTEKSHVGGITYDGGDGTSGNIWICHSESNMLQRIPYTALQTYITGSKECVNYTPDELEMSDEDGFHQVASKPSAIAYNPMDGYLWVTEFLKPDAGREATMAAYEYKDGKLIEVSKYLHPVEEDYLGVTTEDMDDEEKEAACVSAGAIVVSVVTEKEGLELSEESSSEPETAFLEEGDIITAVDDTEITDAASLNEALKDRQVGELVNIRAIRNQGDGSTAVLSGAIELVKRSTKSAVRTIPYCVQGIAFTSSGKTIFSRSWGRNSTKKQFISELMVYKATWNAEEMWDENEIWQEEMAVALPPMAEEVEMNGDELYILFESSAMTYLEGTDGNGKSESPIDKIISVSLE